MSREMERESMAVEGEVSKEKALERQDLMRKAAEVLALLHARTTARAFRARKDDSQHLAYARATMQAVQISAGLLRDADLDELAARLAVLEQRRA